MATKQTTGGEMVADSAAERYWHAEHCRNLEAEREERARVANERWDTADGVGGSTPRLRSQWQANGIGEY